VVAVIETVVVGSGQERPIQVEKLKVLYTISYASMVMSHSFTLTVWQ